MKVVQPSDLKIGNYIRISNADTNLSDKIGRIGKVIQLEDDRIIILLSKKWLGDTYCSDLVGEMEAIPIDREKLLSMGWRKKSFGDLDFTQLSTERHATLHDDNTLVITRGVCNKRHHYKRETMLCIKLDGIHELQNALTSCGIKDMISYEELV